MNAMLAPQKWPTIPVRRRKTLLIFTHEYKEKIGVNGHLHSLTLTPIRQVKMPPPPTAPPPPPPDPLPPPQLKLKIGTTLTTVTQLHQQQNAKSPPSCSADSSKQRKRLFRRRRTATGHGKHFVIPARVLLNTAHSKLLTLTCHIFHS